MNRQWFVDLRRRLSGAGHVWYHIGLVSVSATIAMLLPYLAQGFLIYWELVKNEKVYLLSVEIAVAVVLIILLNFLGRSVRDAKLAKAARGAGLVHVFIHHFARVWLNVPIESRQGATCDVRR